MTRAEAVKKLERLYGKGKIYYRVLTTITSPEKRAGALDRLRSLRAQKDAIDAEIQAWLNAQPFYQEKSAERKRLYLAIREAEGQGLADAFRFTIGRNIGWANEVTGAGDTWEEAFAQAEQKNRGAA